MIKLHNKNDKLSSKKKRIIIALSGASGQIFGVNILKKLSKCNVETYLIVSNTAKKILELETGISVEELKKLAYKYFEYDDLTAPISSGSFYHDGMIIAPCSINTASSIAYGITNNLITRAADVTLKERRPLIILIRESPLHIGHLRTLLLLAEMGAIIMPPVPAFYIKPKTIDDLIDNIVGRVLEKLDIQVEFKRWSGLSD